MQQHQQQSSRQGQPTSQIDHRSSQIYHRSALAGSESRPAAAATPRRGLPLQPFDRIMLKAVSENLSHLRRNGQQLPKPGMSNGQSMSKPVVSANGQAVRVEAGSGPYIEPSAVLNGNVSVERTPSIGSGNNRLDYNKKALSDIRQSLQNYHVPSSANHSAPLPTSQPTVNGFSTADNLMRHVEEMSRQSAALSGRNAVWEVAERLANREVQNVTSNARLNVPVGSKVLRKPSFEEKYQYSSTSTTRTGSPAGSDPITTSSRSDSPSLPFWDIPINGVGVPTGQPPPTQQSTYCESYDLQSMTTTVSRLGLYAGGLDQGGMFRDRAALDQMRGGLDQGMMQRPCVMGRDYVPPAGCYVPCTSVVTRTHPATVVNCRPVSGPPRTCTANNTVFGLKNSQLINSCNSGAVSLQFSSSTAGGLQIAAATALPSAQPCYATVPDRQFVNGPMNPVPNTNMSAAATNVVSKPVASWSTKQPPIVMQQVRSVEVAWPSAQKATTPTTRLVHDVGLPDGAAQSVHDTVEYCPGAPVSCSVDFSCLTPVTVVSSTMSFGDPCDVSLRDFQTCESPPLSQLSSSSANSSDIAIFPPPALPDKPPPPYPGRAPLRNPIVPLRQVPPPPLVEEPSPVVIIDDIDTTDCEHIESPKPERRADDRRRNMEFCESKLRHFSPQAFRFFMEQHIENVLKMHQQRLNRRMQLESEMSQCQLPAATQAQIRRMLAQKESNYLRLRRAKMDRSMFEHVAQLGTGAFGEVDLVRKRDSGVLFALKTLRKRDVLKRNQVAHVKAERDILSEADNEWVVRLYYSFQDSVSLYFVMDYIPGGDLMGLLIKFGVFDDNLAQFYIAELVVAIESVHAMGFIHRDIKPDNILIDKDGHIRLTDFGLCTGFRWTHNSKYYQNGNHPRQDSMEPEGGWSECGINGADLPTIRHQDLIKPLVRRKLRHQRDLAHSLVGTPNYIAPEVLARSGYTACCDWWSVGVILYEMRVGHPPFLAASAAETQRKVINWRHTLHIPNDADLSAETVDLILRLCCAAEDRLGRSPGGATDLKSHPFFAGIEFDSLRRRTAPYIPPVRYATDTSNFDPVEPDDRLARRSASLDSLLTPGAAVVGNTMSCEGGRHAFLEFTFRRFFDDEGHAHATRMSDPDNGQMPVYV